MAIFLKLISTCAHFSMTFFNYFLSIPNYFFVVPTEILSALINSYSAGIMILNINYFTHPTYYTD